MGWNHQLEKGFEHSNSRFLSDWMHPETMMVDGSLAMPCYDMLERQVFLCPGDPTANGLI